MNRNQIIPTDSANIRDVWRIEGDALLQSALEWTGCPPLLRQALAGAVSWQVRNETPVRSVLASPRIAPQWVAALLVLGTIVTVEGERGPVEIPLEVLLQQRPKGATTALHVPLGGPGRTWGQAHVARSPADPPIVAAVAVVDWADGVVRVARLALTGVWRSPVGLAESAGMLIGSRLDDEQIRDVALAVQRETSPPDNFLGSADYRREMAAVLARRALKACHEGASHE